MNEPTSMLAKMFSSSRWENQYISSIKSWICSVLFVNLGPYFGMKSLASDEETKNDRMESWVELGKTTKGRRDGNGMNSEVEEGDE